jgi:hypothetical protein
MASSSTTSSALLDGALAAIQKKFRSRIIDAYLELKRRFAKATYDSAWDTSGLSVGKFCESVLRFLQFTLTATSIPFGKHIPNFPDECRKLISLPASAGLESLRVIVPRALAFLYTLRGKRGIGHVGGDVEANEIDAATAVRVCDWILSELVRIYHGLSLEEAQALVNAVAERLMPEIWEVRGKKRVLRKGLPYKHQVLLLLYSDPDTDVLSEDLLEWTEYSNAVVFRQKVLTPLHKERFIDYDRDNELVRISPLGIHEVETVVLPQ